MPKYVAPGRELVGERQRAHRRVAAGAAARDRAAARRRPRRARRGSARRSRSPRGRRPPTPRSAARGTRARSRSSRRSSRRRPRSPRLVQNCDREVEDRASSLPVGPAVAHHDERRPLAVRRVEVRVRRRVDERVRGEVAARSGTRSRAGPRSTRRRPAPARSSGAPRVVPSRGRARTTWFGIVAEPATSSDGRALGARRTAPPPGVVRQVERLELAGLGVEDAERTSGRRSRRRTRSARRRGTRTSASRRPTRGSRTRPRPRGARSARRPWIRSRFHQPLRSLAKTRSPAGLHSGCQIDSSPSRPATCTGSPSVPSPREVGDEELAAVPRHPREVPREEREPARRRARCAGSSRSRGRRRSIRRLRRAVGRDRDELVDDVAARPLALVALADADPEARRPA